ncbi:MAG: DUF2889 domain-containing protein [Proteobacteria bacterium]|nr:DUF2889 domain-containing protein [Pseudomonadota bacterium]
MELPVEGHPLHTRSITSFVSQHPRGRIRARGRLIDLRKCSFTPMLGDDMQTAGIIHLMGVDAEVDAGTRRLEKLDVTQESVAVEPSERSRGESCRDPAGLLQALVGERLDAAFPRRLGELYGGPRGCSHVLTLLQSMASALPRALDLEEARGGPRAAGETLYRRSVLVDGSATPNGGLLLAVQHHDFHNTPLREIRQPLEVLAEHREVRALAELDMNSLELQRVGAWERERSHGTLTDAPWGDRTPEIRPLVGARIMPGLGRRVLDLLGPEPENAFLAGALLQLAPGFVQCTAAFADRFYARGERIGGGRTPSFLQLGGAENSCYMFRSGAPLLQVRNRSESSESGG